ncbi:LPS export ABC transporter periplasmic protein LptC [Thiolapillus sp.]
MRIWLLLLLLGILGYTWWASRPEPPEEHGAADGGQQIQDYYMDGLDLRQFDNSGRLRHRLQARDMHHFRNSGITRLTAPSYVLHEEGRPVWAISAQEGELSADQTLLQLFGATTIERKADENHPAMQIRTANLRIYPQTEHVETDEAVTVTSEQNWIESTGMQAWFKPPTRILFPAQARAHYVAQ